MAVPGRRSLAAVAVPGSSVLFPARFVACAVLAGVRLSVPVPSSSPVVAAPRLALARSLRLGPPLAGRSHSARKRNQPLRPWRRGKRHQQPRTTKAHAANQAPLGLDVRPHQHEVSSLRSKQSQFALHSPLATHLVPRSQPRHEARNRRTRYIIERWSPRAGAVVRAWRRGASVASLDGCW